VLAHVFQDHQVTLLWGESRQADGYLIHRGDDPQGLKPIAAVEEASYIDNTTQPGKTYYYTVRAYNEHGQSGATSVATVTLPAPKAPEPAPAPAEMAKEEENQSFAGKRLRVQRKSLEKKDAGGDANRTMPSVAAPPAPTGLRAMTHGTKFIALQWTPPLPDLDYRVYRSETPWCCYGLVAETKETQYLDTVPEPATKYYYFVQAVRGGRSSEASPMAEALTFPPLPPPEAPVNLRTAPQGTEAIELRWNHARGAAAYVIYARLDPNDEFQIIGHSLDCGWIHEGLPPDAFVDYRVQAYHDSGASELSGVCTGRAGVVRVPPRNQSRPPAPPPPPAAPAARRFPSFSLQSFQR